MPVEPIDEYLNVKEWMELAAKEISEMPFRANRYQRDIALMIAKHVPVVYFGAAKKYKGGVQNYRDKQRRRDGLCWRCGMPVARRRDGKAAKMCQAHLEQDRARYWNGAKTSVAAD